MLGLPRVFQTVGRFLGSCRVGPFRTVGAIWRQGTLARSTVESLIVNTYAAISKV